MDVEYRCNGTRGARKNNVNYVELLVGLTIAKPPNIRTQAGYQRALDISKSDINHKPPNLES